MYLNELAGDPVEYNGAPTRSAFENFELKITAANQAQKMKIVMTAVLMLHILKTAIISASKT